MNDESILEAIEAAEAITYAAEKFSATAKAYVNSSTCDVFTHATAATSEAAEAATARVIYLKKKESE